MTDQIRALNLLQASKNGLTKKSGRPKISRNEILISGFGGQGVVLAGRILGSAAVLENLQASMLISHGTETRGGYVRSQLVISDQIIDSPIVDTPDVFCAMSQSAYKRFCSLVKGGLIIYDPDFVSPDSDVPVKMLAVPARLLALNKLGSELPANIILLGVILQKLKFISIGHAKVALEKIIPRNKDANLEALQIGWEFS